MAERLNWTELYWTESLEKAMFLLSSENEIKCQRKSVKILTEYGRIRIWDINVEYFFFSYSMITEIQSVGPEIVIHFREKCQMKSQGEKKHLELHEGHK